jgi:hypothetical protein
LGKCPKDDRNTNEEKMLFKKRNPIDTIAEIRPLSAMLG